MFQFTEPRSDLLHENVQNLRKVIAEKVYPNMGIKESEVFISDGAQNLRKVSLKAAAAATTASRSPSTRCPAPGRWPSRSAPSPSSRGSRASGSAGRWCPASSATRTAPPRRRLALAGERNRRHREMRGEGKGRGNYLMQRMRLP